MLSRRNQHVPRSGLSIIEVLTSIVVAMIGVFGIMILIPFSVKQAQSGLDRDAATVLARNGMAMLEVQGYRNPQNWTSAPGTSVDPTVPQMFFIDPLGVLENGGDYTSTTFPINVDAATTGYPSVPENLPAGEAFRSYRIRPASLFSATGADMLLADARRMFRSRDELVFGEAADELEGPTQYFDIDSSNLNQTRQSVGSLSWAVLAVPYKPAGVVAGAAWKYRMYVIVFKDRSPLVGAVEDNQMHAAQVNHTGTPSTPLGLASPVGTVFLNTTNPLPADYGVAKGDWVMLINRAMNSTDDSPTVGTTVEKGFGFQVGFYRIVNLDINATNALSSVTLDGPDFNFGNAPTAGMVEWDPNGTFLVHLRNVVAVYERSIVPESESDWNLAF